MNKPFANSLAASFFIFIALSTNAQCYNEDSCYKDYVTDKGEKTVITVNRDTGAVESYWSEKDNAWLKPSDDDRKKLQRLYNKKVQLREMQGVLNEMHDETWYTTDENISPHHR